MYDDPELADGPINLDKLPMKRLLPQGALSEHLEHVRNAVVAWCGDPTFVSVQKWDEDCKAARYSFLKLKQNPTAEMMEKEKEGGAPQDVKGFEQWCEAKYQACLSYETLRRDTRFSPFVWERPQFLIGLCKRWGLEFMDKRILPSGPPFHEGHGFVPCWSEMTSWESWSPSGKS